MCAYIIVGQCQNKLDAISLSLADHIIQPIAASSHQTRSCFSIQPVQGVVMQGVLQGVYNRVAKLRCALNACQGF